MEGWLFIIDRKFNLGALAVEFMSSKLTGGIGLGGSTWICLPTRRINRVCAIIRTKINRDHNCGLGKSETA
jgi:hypothetical protein